MLMTGWIGSIGRDCIGVDVGELTLNGESNSCSQGNWEEDRSRRVLEDQRWQSDRGDVGSHCCGLLVLLALGIEIQCIRGNGIGMV